MKLTKLLATLLFSAVCSSASASYNAIYVFGDSLSDSGNLANVYAQLPASALPPGSPSAVPGTPYYQGVFSNGPIYIQRVAQAMGLSVAPSTLGGSDYAYGGARTEYQPFGLPFQGIQSQFNSYINQVANHADANALYVVWGGANNIQDILSGRHTDVTGHSIPDASQTVQDLFGIVTGLYGAGARHFLIPNLPNLGLTPRVAAAGAGAQAYANQLSVVINNDFSNLLDQFRVDHADFSMVRFDAYGLFNDISSHPGQYGLTNVTSRCYTGDDLGFTGGGGVCTNPDSYMFWDGIHPSAATGAIVADAMLKALPEPTGYALLLTGLALVGAMRRTRHSQNPA